MGCPCCKQEEPEPLLTQSGSEEPVTRQSFDIIKVIGRGNYGKVCLVKRKGNPTLYAMKILKKSVLDSRKQKRNAQIERAILEKSDCPFIVQLHWAFQTTSKLYLVLEYMSGGELFFHLSKEGTFSEPRAKFYCAEILIALNYLHKNGVIYRDLKPENILLDTDGHVRLTDFGLSKNGMDEKNLKTYTFCGTPEYLAPEILRNTGHTYAVDYWSLGAVMYYMISGAPPFYSRNKNEIFNKVLKVPIPPLEKVTKEANDLFQSLLKIKEDERLKDFEATKSHPWFSGINWEEIEQKKAVPPFRPKVSKSLDTSNFDACFTNEPPQESIEITDMLTPATNHYTGFTFNT